jgi:hypothetical protein
LHTWAQTCSFPTTISPNFMYFLTSTYFGKVFTDVFRGAREIVAKWTGLSSLTSTLSEELARNVRRIYHCQRIATNVRTESCLLLHTLSSWRTSRSLKSSYTAGNRQGRPTTTTVGAIWSRWRNAEGAGALMSIFGGHIVEAE